MELARILEPMLLIRLRMQRVRLFVRMISCRNGC